MSIAMVSPRNPALARPKYMAATATLDQTLDDARHGDSSAFGQLILHYQAAAQRLAEQILRTEEAAADAVQEASIKAHRAMHRFEDGNFRSWLLRIVANTCYDHLRRTKRRQTVSLDELVESAGYEYGAVDPIAEENPEQTVMQQETMQSILGAINDLPSWHRTVVMLVDVQGYDYAEAAEMLRLPLGTVKSRLSRARAALRDLLVERRVVATAQNP